MSSATANCSSTEPCRSGSACRSLIGAAIIGMAIGWFLSGACLTKYDLEMGRLTGPLQLAAARAQDSQSKDALATVAQQLRDSKAGIQSEVLVSVLGAFCLCVTGVFLIHPCARPAPTQAPPAV